MRRSWTAGSRRHWMRRGVWGHPLWWSTWLYTCLVREQEAGCGCCVHGLVVCSQPNLPEHSNCYRYSNSCAFFLCHLAAESSAADAVVKFQLWQAQAMLNAASRGRLATVQQLLDRGCPVDVCDYDKRTGLMLAAANGHEVSCGVMQKQWQCLQTQASAAQPSCPWCQKLVERHAHCCTG
jgi:hypothetical protein